MTSIVLTSDFPATPNQAIVDCMQRASARPRIACIAPVTASRQERFPALAKQFADLGFTRVESCDIDERPDERQLAELGECDVVYLTGGDPIVFRRHILRTGLATELRRCVENGGLILGASGGAMQLTRNVSLYRLLDTPLDEVATRHSEHEGLGLVDCELLPHLNRHDAAFLETVRAYSERVDHDVIALADGAALLHSNGDETRCVGEAVRFRDGSRTPISGA